MNLASMTFCTFIQPLVNSMQWMLNLIYLPMSFIGISAPPVSSWFQPLLSCTLT